MMSRIWNFRWHCGLGLIGLFFVLQMTTGCVAPQGLFVGTTPTETPINRIERGMVDATDLPSGWSLRSTGAPRNSNGAILARYRDYQGPQRSAMPFVRTGQQMYLYSNEIESREAFQKLVTDSIPSEFADKWPRPVELDFTLHASESRIGCSSGLVNNIPHRVCLVIARYDEVVTRLDGLVFEDRWLTMAQFRHLLERVDAKMEAIREPQGNATPTPAP